MKDGKIETSDFGTLIELEEGTGLVTSYNELYHRLNGRTPELSDIVIARRVNEGLIEVCSVDGSLVPTGANRNQRHVLRYEGKRYELYDIEEGFFKLHCALKEKGL